MKLPEFRDRLLVAIWEIASSTDFGDYIEAKDAADAAGLIRPKGKLWMVVQDLAASGFLREAATLSGDDESGMDVVLLAPGVEIAEELAEKHPEYRTIQIPAAGRYVSLGDNQRGDVRHDLADLQRSIEFSNEGSEEDRTIALSELAAFEATILQPRVSTELINRFVDRVIAWITRTFSKAVVGVVAERLIQRLLGI